MMPRVKPRTGTIGAVNVSFTIKKQQLQNASMSINLACNIVGQNIFISKESYIAIGWVDSTGDICYICQGLIQLPSSATCEDFIHCLVKNFNY